MKRVFALMLALLMLLCFAACADTTGDDDEENEFDMVVSTNDQFWSPEENPNDDKIYYRTINVDEIEITGFSGSHTAHALKIPETIDERKVTSVADDAFKSKTNLTAVELPATITTIGSMAFYGCTELKSITLPTALTSLGDAAFAECIRLESITLPETLETIGFAAFYKPAYIYLKPNSFDIQARSRSYKAECIWISRAGLHTCNCHGNNDSNPVNRNFVEHSFI